jgi:hypothetical protein
MGDGKRCRMRSNGRKLVVVIKLISLLGILFAFSTPQVKAEAQNQTLVVKEVKQLTNDPKMWHQMFLLRRNNGRW